MKLCLITPLAPPMGGIAMWSSLIIRELDKDKEIDVTVLNISPIHSNKRKKNLLERIFFGGIDMLISIKKFLKIIIENSIDIIHINTSGSLALIRDIMLISIAKKHKISVVYHVHYGRIPEIYKRSNLEWKITKKIFDNVEKVITMDKNTYKIVNGIYKKEKVYYIPNPINTGELQLFNRDTKNEICFLGWVIKTKGMEELIKAWNIIEKSNNEWKLRIIGGYDQNYKAFLESNYKLDNIIFDGELEHQLAMQILNKCKIFILPSYTEGFPNVILEAMALEKAIIASKVGAIPDILSDDCGFLIEPKSVDQIVKAINLLVNNETYRNYLANNGKNKCINNYDIKIIYNKYKDIWLSLT